jgi:hypothetical protein
MNSVLVVAEWSVRYNTPLHQCWPLFITSPVLLNMLPVSWVPLMIAPAGVALSVTAAITAPSPRVIRLSAFTAPPTLDWE